MNYQINAAVFSHSGAIRPNNEDNYCFHGEILPMSHTAPAYSHLFLPLNGLMCFAVFDGMGGEQSGEAASYQAAHTLSEQLAQLNTNMLSQDALHSLFLQMNSSICDYAKTHKLSSVGTTAAAVFCTPTQFICANMGDSRIYRFHNGNWCACPATTFPPTPFTASRR